MPLSGVGPIDFLQRLAMQAIQRASREGHEWLLGRAPWRFVDPSQGAHQRLVVGGRCNQRSRCRARLPGLRWHRAHSLREHVPIARFAEDRPELAQPPADGAAPGLQLAERAEDRSQPAQADTQLMQVFGIVRSNDAVRVGGDLLERSAGEDGERFVWTRVAQIRAAPLARQHRLAERKAIAALCLARERKLEPERLDERLRVAVHALHIPALQLYLKLQDRLAFLAGDDGAAIERDFDGSVGEADIGGAPLEARLE